MSAGLLDTLGVRPVINAVGPATRLGSGVLDADVVAAMVEASGVYVRMEELQERAGETIAAITGAEAGYVVNGAAGALTLAAAACIARDDPVLMNRLPDTGSAPNEIVVHRAHRYAYDHALRAAGARFVEVGFPEVTFPYEIDAAIGERTVAVAYFPSVAANVVPLPEVAAIAQRHAVPVVVDASLAVPPPGNLRRFIDEGADLVAFSGGKWIGGPAASGFLAGRADLIRSLALQHQDMDVRIASWWGAGLMEQGIVPGPPHQGLGRSLKVGKEEIVGLIAALRSYVDRDHAGDQRRWHGRARVVVDALAGLPGVTAGVLEADGVERGFPVAEVVLDAHAVGRSAYDVVRLLAAGDPSIAIDDTAAWRGALRVTPTHLRDGEVERVAAALADALEPVAPLQTPRVREG